MEYYGVSGTSLALVKSYLTNRYQYVQFESCSAYYIFPRGGFNPQ